MSINYQKVQAARRKTLRPLTSKQVSINRMWLAYNLNLEGNSPRAIRQILNLRGPDEARRLVAKANRIAKKLCG